VRRLCAHAQAPHVRCSQAAAAVGDDVFFFGGSYYKCASGLHTCRGLHAST